MYFGKSQSAKGYTCDKPTKNTFAYKSSLCTGDVVLNCDILKALQKSQQSARLFANRLYGILLTSRFFSLLGKNREICNHLAPSLCLFARQWMFTSLHYEEKWTKKSQRKQKNYYANEIFSLDFFFLLHQIVNIDLANVFFVRIPLMRQNVSLLSRFLFVFCSTSAFFV